MSKSPPRKRSRTDLFCCCEGTAESLRNGEEYWCQALSTRGPGLTQCLNAATAVRSIKSSRKKLFYCMNHIEQWRSHKVCGQCAVFILSGIVEICNFGHMTHSRCYRDEGCSHCGKETKTQILQDDGDVKCVSRSGIESDMSSHRSSRYRKIEYCKNIHSNSLNLVQSAEKLNSDNATALPTFIRLLNDPRTKIFKPEDLEDLLHWAVSNEFVDHVHALRIAHCPVSSEVLTLLPGKTMELLKALRINGRFYTTLMDESMLCKMAEKGDWEILTSLLQHFDCRVGSGDGAGLSCFISIAPDHVKTNGFLVYPTYRNTTENVLRFYRENVDPLFVIVNFKCNFYMWDLAKGCETFPVGVVGEASEVEGQPAYLNFVYSTRVQDTSHILAQSTSRVDMHCCCEAECSSSLCDCSYRDSAPYLDWAHFECSSLCTCGSDCPNRNAQNGPTYPVEVFKTVNDRGWALRSLTSIPAGAFIGEYIGELLSAEDTCQRDDTYFFETYVGDELYTIDAKEYGNFTRFINHSCEPNSKPAMIIWDAALPLCHICFFAARDIVPGEEITFTYGSKWWNEKIRDFACLCGAAECKFTPAHREEILKEDAVEQTTVVEYG